MQPFKKVIFIGAALLLIAALFTTAQADYLGPNRVIVTYETIYQRQACRFVDVRDPAGPGVCACTMTVYVGPKDSCPGSVDSHYFHTDVCGWSSENPDCTDAGLDSISGPSSSIQSCSLGDQACTAVVIEHRTTLAAATVSGAITCSTPGQNGWCIGPAVLNVSGSEPLSGYSILTIEGTRNSESFACPGDHCSNVPLSEGSNDFQFWAISSYGDSSAMGSASASVDTQAPTISGSLSGTQGENGWYTSAVTLSAAATDPAPGSGIASFEVSADGAAWQPCSGSLTLGDGVHTVSLRTADAAGWTASAEQTFSVDTQAPQLSADLAGHLVSPGRYNTTATLSASGSDTGSGLNRIEYQDNSGGWTTYTDPLVFYNGQHEIEVRAVDQAGLTSDVQTFSFFVESHGPYITVPDHWQVGQTISLSVQANSFSLGSVSIVVSDPQQRWPDVEQVYPASGDSFTTDFHWDGQFNGQTAPAGQYTVSVYASDVMSNLSVSHSQVTIPVVIPTAVPTLTATGTVAAAESTTAAAATATPQPSSTPTAVVAGVPVTSFSSPASPATQPAATLPSNVLWGGAAAAVIGAATAAALEAARKRKEEEEAQRQAAEAAAAQFNAAEKGIDALIAANQDSQWLMQQWLGSQGLPTSYPTQAALVAAYEAAREAEKKAKEQEALNDAYQSFKQADQQSMQEYEAYQGEQEKHASSNGNKKANSISPSLKVLNDIKPVEIGNENEPPAEGCSWYEIWNSCWWKNVGNSIMNAFSSTSNQVVWGKTTPTSTPTAIPTPTKTVIPTPTITSTPRATMTPTTIPDVVNSPNEITPVNVENVLQTYGVSVNGFSEKTKVTIASGAFYSGEAFKKYFLNINGASAFNNAFGQIQVIYDPQAGINGYYITQGSVITCDEDDKLNVQTIIHEFGHVFENHQISLQETLNVESDKIHRASDLDNIMYYDLNGKENFLDKDPSTGVWMATNEGFKFPSYPGREHLLSDLSSLTDGIAKEEQFADMVMNMILQGQLEFPKNGFSDDPAGIARLKYIRDQQIPWVLSASGGGQ